MAGSSRSVWNRWYSLSLLAFTLAMLSKGSVAILPLVLLLIAWWQHGRIHLRDILRMLPFFVVAAVLTAVNIWFQASHTNEAIRVVTTVQRVLGAGAIVWFYLYKAVLPLNLVFVYPQWDVQANQLRWWLPLLAAVLITAALWWRRNIVWVRALLFGWAFFCIALLPVMGFVDVGFMRYSLVADHYQYLAIIGVAATVAAGWYTLRPVDQSQQIRRWLLNATAAAAVGLLGLLTWHQSQLYANPISLYRATLVENPASWAIQSSLGDILVQRGQTEEGIQHLEKALELNPGSSSEINCTIGTALENAGRYGEAIDRFQQAITAKPEFAVPYNNLAWLLATAPDEKLRDPARAVELAQKTAQLNPTLPGNFNTLGIAEYRAGKWQEAIRWLNKSTKAGSGGSAFDWFFLAMAEERLGLHLEARDDYVKAIEWMEKHAPHNEELIRFRREAEELLGQNRPRM